MISPRSLLRSPSFRIPAVALFLTGCLGWNANAATALKVGDPAPEFKLKGSDGKTYKLSDFKGKSAVVVAWYPKALTRG